MIAEVVIYGGESNCRLAKRRNWEGVLYTLSLDYKAPNARK